MTFICYEKCGTCRKAKAWLEGMGILCEPVRIDEFSAKPFTFFFDPDGLPLELHE